MKHNLCLMTDSYKFSQYLQYPKGTTKVCSYIESRGGLYDETIMFGLQYYIKKYLLTPVTQEDVEVAAKIAAAHGLPFNKEGWDYIVQELDGKLPIKIKALPEGTIVPVLNVLAIVENTDPKCYWLTSYLETLLLKVWYPITVASRSLETKKIIKKFLEETGDVAGLPFKLHDFGYRGVSSEESAALGGAAHLLNFLGTDTVASIPFLMEYYNATEMPGFSIPASEHSTMTSWTREGEKDAFRNMLEQFKDNPLVACVSDSYNIYKAIEMWGELKETIIANGQLLVVRPDSGDPVSMSLECVQGLEKHFGCTTNDKGYKVLNHVRVIYGDGIASPAVVGEICENLKQHGYSIDNMAFGQGGGLLQKVDRDTQKFAMKCSYILKGEEFVPVYKDPITDHGKVSKKGALDIIKVDGKFRTVESHTEEISLPNSELVTVYENGTLLVDYTLDEIRKRAAI